VANKFVLAVIVNYCLTIFDITLFHVARFMFKFCDLVCYCLTYLLLHTYTIGMMGKFHIIHVYACTTNC